MMLYTYTVRDCWLGSGGTDWKTGLNTNSAMFCFDWVVFLALVIIVECFSLSNTCVHFHAIINCFCSLVLKRAWLGCVRLQRSLWPTHPATTRYYLGLGRGVYRLVDTQLLDLDTPIVALEYYFYWIPSLPYTIRRPGK